MTEYDDETDDKSLSELYAGISREQPSTELDNRILSEAGKAVASAMTSSGKSHGPFSGRWTVPASLAAVVVLSVIVITTIEREQPDSLTGLPQMESTERQPVPKEKPAQPRADTASGDMAANTPEALEPMRAPQPAPKAVEEKSAVADDEQRIVGKKQEAPVALRSLASGSRALAKGAPPAKQKKTDTKTERLETLTDAPSGIANVRSGEADTSQDNDVSGKASEAEPAESKAGAGDAAASALAQRAVTPGVAESIVGGSKAPAQQRERQQEASPNINLPNTNKSFSPNPQGGAQPLLSLASPRRMETECRRLSELACYQSTNCIVQQQEPSSSYICRPADNVCEQGFSQSSHGRQGCEQNKNCVFVPADCYCAPGADCECEGGPPAMCRLKETTQKRE